MEISTLIRIRSNFYKTNYLRENSSWYKYLNRNPESISNLEQEVREYYKLTAKDKMRNLEQKLALVRNFMEILN